MNDRIPFGFVSEGGEAYIVQGKNVCVATREKWERCNTDTYDFETLGFWEEVAKRIELDRRARAEHELVWNYFRCPVSPLAQLIEELVCRDMAEEEIVLLMDQRVYKRLAYDVALGYRDIGPHHAAMMGQQALLFDGAYIRVGFSKFLPGWGVNFGWRENPATRVQIRVVAVTSGQVEIDLPDWCKHGRYDIHLS